MRILLALRSVDQAEGGPITAAFALADALAEQGHEVTVTAHDDGGRTNNQTATNRSWSLITFPLTRRFWEHSKRYAGWLRSNCDTFDLVIINSMWISHVHYAARACSRAGTPYILRPHGCLTISDMQHHKWRKRLYWLGHDRMVARKALAIHCTGQAEAQDAFNLGLNNVVTIPLGIPTGLSTISFEQHDRNQILILGRIAEKKGIDLIIRALAEVKEDLPKLRLHVVGTDHRGLQRGYEQLATDLGVARQVYFAGHLEGPARDKYFEASGVFLLPSKDENFGLAAAEAMVAAMPLILTDAVSHVSLVVDSDAGWIVERNPRSIAQALRALHELSEDAYRAMCQRARTAALANYSWSRTAEEIAALMSDGMAGSSKTP